MVIIKWRLMTRQFYCCFKIPYSEHTSLFPVFGEGPKSCSSTSCIPASRIALVSGVLSYFKSISWFSLPATFLKWRVLEDIWLRLGFLDGVHPCLSLWAHGPTTVKTGAWCCPPEGVCLPQSLACPLPVPRETTGQVSHPSWNALWRWYREKINGLPQD